ncbi:hypothetical protein BH24PSE2_BH24PSE2_01770 [soil metagenome]
MPTDTRAASEAERVLRAQAGDLEARLAASNRIYADAVVRAYLAEVTDRLLRTKDPKATGAVQPYVLTDAAANAFMLPNGALFITTGLMARLDNEAQLATVIGHELSHFLNRDNLRSRRAADRAKRKAAIMNFFTLGLAESITEDRQMADVHRHSRNQELRADSEGLKMMMAAGYAAAAAEDVFEHWVEERIEGTEQVSFRSHPRLVERAAAYKMLANAGSRAAKGRLDAEHYERAIGKLLLDHAAAAIGRRDIEGAAFALDRHLARHPEHARAWFLRGEMARLGGPGTRDSALEAYERAGRLPNPPAALYKSLGLLHRQRGEHRLAAVSLQRYLQLEPDAVDAPILRGYIAEPAPG